MILNLSFLVISLVFILTSAVIVTILGSFLIFWCDLHYLQLNLVVHLSNHQIWHNYGQIMLYLINPLKKRLILADFFSSAQGLEHFREVKELFLLVGLVWLFSGAIIIWWQKQHQLLPLMTINLQWLRILGVVPIVLGALSGLDFDGFFVAFHQILFRNNDWLFDPLKDPVINILPDTFFLHCFILAFLIFELLVLISLYWQHCYAQKRLK